VKVFSLNRGITVSEDFKIFISDKNNSRIVRIDNMDGNGWISFGSQGSGSLFFDSPGAIAVTN
jgi:hypothetical protein